MKGFLIFMAIVFAVATIFLYNASIIKQDSYNARILGVSETINIQATVFCAATAITCVINSVGAIIISALETEVQSSTAKTKEAVKEATAQEESKSREEKILSQGGWKCPQCGTINQSYVSSCGCGMNKRDALSKQS